MKKKNILLFLLALLIIAAVTAVLVNTPNESLWIGCNVFTVIMRLISRYCPDNGAIKYFKYVMIGITVCLMIGLLVTSKDDYGRLFVLLIAVADVIMLFVGLLLEVIIKSNNRKR